MNSAAGVATQRVAEAPGRVAGKPVLDIVRWPVADDHAAVERLTCAASVRLDPVDEGHVDMLSSLRGGWPPILVHRPTLRVIDGVHRVHAARRLGHATIACRYFDGDADDAYLEALRLNAHQGLPLTLRERREAATKVLALRPHWSDRRIAESAGLSPGTVAQIRARRACPTDQSEQMDTPRVGRDGRARRVNGAVARQRIAAALRARPTDSLRQIASLVGTSPETVRKVRLELARTADAEPATGTAADGEPAWSPDAALVSSRSGAEFTEWFQRTCLDDEWASFVDQLPLGRVYEIADEAHRRATCWSQFAEAVERRARERRG